MDLKEIRCEDVDWIQLARDKASDGFGGDTKLAEDFFIVNWFNFINIFNWLFLQLRRGFAGCLTTLYEVEMFWNVKCITKWYVIWNGEWEIYGPYEGTIPEIPETIIAGSGGCAISGAYGLPPLEHWGLGFASRSGHGYMGVCVWVVLSA